jgi:pimeloyl-ACP methyl ester carboxylesterase
VSGDEESSTRLETFEVSANGLTFSAIAAGERGARPVVLLHGFPQTSASWHKEMRALADAGYRALAFDQRGYSSGARPPEISDYGIEHTVGDALAVADAQGMERFDLVGHDWGAMVAWVLAAKHPDRVRTLTAVSVPHPGSFGAVLRSGEEDQAQRSSYIGVFRQPGGVAEKILLGDDGSGDGLRRMFAMSGMPEGAPEVDQFTEVLTQPGALTAALNWYRAMDGSFGSDAGPVTMPTLFVWGNEDIAVGRTSAEGNVKWVSGEYRFEELDGVGHWIPEAASERLSSLMLSHLAAH